MKVRRVETIVKALNKAKVQYFIVGGPAGNARSLTFCQKLKWLEETGMLSLRFQASCRR
jgi:hypothetical protein